MIALRISNQEMRRRGCRALPHAAMLTTGRVGDNWSFATAAFSFDERMDHGRGACRPEIKKAPERSAGNKKST
jgi:hypothetical protein